MSASIGEDAIVLYQDWQFASLEPSYWASLMKRYYTTARLDRSKPVSMAPSTALFPKRSPRCKSTTDPERPIATKESVVRIRRRRQQQTIRPSPSSTTTTTAAATSTTASSSLPSSSSGQTPYTYSRNYFSSHGRIVPPTNHRLCHLSPTTTTTMTTMTDSNDTLQHDVDQFFHTLGPPPRHKI